MDNYVAYHVHSDYSLLDSTTDFNLYIEKAKKLLLSTAYSVTEISSLAGYSDYRVFTKVFKKTEGVTPSQFRREFLGREKL